MKKILLGLFITIALCFSMGGLATAAIDPGPPPSTNSPTDAAKRQVCQGVSGQVGGSCGGQAQSINRVMEAVLQVITVIAGLAAVIMIIMGGIKYITSEGDSTKVSSAKSTLIYAIVGIVVVVMAQAIVHFVLAEAQ